MTWPRALRLHRVEAARAGTLRLTFDVSDAAGHDFFAYATALSSGTLVDLQSSDSSLAETTGHPMVGVAEQVVRRRAHTRASGVIRELDQGRRRRP